MKNLICISPILFLATTVAFANPIDLYCNRGIKEAGGMTILRDLKRFEVYSCSDAANFDLSKLKDLDEKTKSDYSYSLGVLKTFALKNQLPKMRVEDMVPLTTPKVLSEQ